VAFIPSKYALNMAFKLFLPVEIPRLKIMANERKEIWIF